MFFILLVLFFRTNSFELSEEFFHTRKNVLLSQIREPVLPKQRFSSTGEIPKLVPFDGMVINSSCVFEKNEYTFPNGISIGADGVFLDLGASTLIGKNFENVGIFVPGFDKVEITNGVIKNYYYGIKIEFSHDVRINQMDVSYNYYDPHAHDPQPPWLDINITPEKFGDRTNLGGGIWLNNVTHGRIEDNKMMYQENGIDMFYCHNVGLYNNDASNNLGWGFHLFKSKLNVIRENRADNCTRKGPYPEYTADTAGLLLNCECSDNAVIDNSFRYGGDGIFVSGFPREKKNECCPSNFNYFENNDCSFSPNNAVEDTFSTGNLFVNNTCSDSNYGFWLGYSHTNFITWNVMKNNRIAGVAIEHGQKNRISGNEFFQNQRGVFVWTDFIEHFPSSEYECLYLPDQQHSTLYEIHENYFVNNVDQGIKMYNTTDCTIFDNYFEGESGHTALDGQEGDRNLFFIKKRRRRNIVGGMYQAGNYWSDYTGKDTTGDGIGNTDVPYLAKGNLQEKWGDEYPLVKPTNK